ncbi:hypothetical protein [Ferruginibacter sp. SUN106]|uniref:hypothetical protein n=1 Tax=Ferruginibacter sp. SUN106 TaxID=2978348 RepID=UPI003D366E82
MANTRLRLCCFIVNSLCTRTGGYKKPTQLVFLFSLAAVVTNRKLLFIQVDDHSYHNHHKNLRSNKNTPQAVLSPYWHSIIKAFLK